MNQEWMSDEFEPGLVSVIIPTYNRSRLLKEAILSVYEQKYRPIECIIVDDGSIDDTEDIVRSLRYMNDPSFNIIFNKQNNAGAQVARNKGSSLSKGEYIQYLDSDDLIYPDKLYDQVLYLEAHPDCDGVFGDWQKGLPDKNELIVAYLSNDPISQFLTKLCIAIFSFLFRRHAVKSAGKWDDKIKRNQEIDFHIRAILSGVTFHYSKITTGLWRVYPGERISTTTNMNDVIYFYNKMENLLISRKLWSNSLRRQISVLYVWIISENISSPNSQLIPVLLEAVRLDPEISFYKNPKLRLLVWLTGKSFAFNVWLNRFRRINVNSNG